MDLIGSVTRAAGCDARDEIIVGRRGDMKDIVSTLMKAASVVTTYGSVAWKRS